MIYIFTGRSSDTQNVHAAFDNALEQSLQMQDAIYKKMAAKGWYPTEQADQQKIQKVKAKYSQGQMS